MEGRCGAVARNRAGSRCVNSGGQATEGWQCSVSDGVDARVEDVQSAGDYAAVDRAGAQAEVEELPADDDAVLQLSQHCDGSVGATP
jgi:hypothetical protein